MSWWYPDLSDPQFHEKLHAKREFGPLLSKKRENTESGGSIAPHQRFVKNFITPKTPYESLLLFHALGSGKTCSAISIAENFKPRSESKSAKRILVLVKNQTIAQNFRNEISSEFCTGKTYLSRAERQVLASPDDPAFEEAKEDVMRRIKRKVSERYEFMTFGVLVNRVLGTRLPESFGSGGGGGEDEDGSNPDLDFSIDELEPVPARSPPSRSPGRSSRSPSGRSPSGRSPPSGRNPKPSSNDDDDLDEFFGNIEKRISNSKSGNNRGGFDYDYDAGVFDEILNDTPGPGTSKSKSKSGKPKSKSAIKADAARRITGGSLLNLDNRVIIIDEAHNMVGNDVYTALVTLLDKSINTKIVLLTATPVFDNLLELPELINILVPPSQRLPIRKDFLTSQISKSQQLIQKTKSDGVFQLTSHGKNVFTRLLSGRVSYIGIDSSTFPKRIDIGIPLVSAVKHSIVVFECPMSPYQTSVYVVAVQKDKMAEGSGIGWKHASDAATMTYPNNEFGSKGFRTVTTGSGKGGKGTRLAGAAVSTFENIIHDKTGSKFKSTKALSNSNAGVKFKSSEHSLLFQGFGPNGQLEKYGSKLFYLIQNISKSPGSCFVYSQFVNGGGIAIVRLVLIAYGFTEYPNRSAGANSPTFAIIDGSVSTSARERILKRFNSEANNRGQLIRVLLGTPSISEGVTLKNVRQIHILEPPWNMSRLEQIIGRGIRTNSHATLPIQERTVQVFKYVATYPDKETIDQYKYKICENKDRAIKQIERIMKQAAIDCKYTSSGPSSYSPEDQFSAKCDYMSCDYSCPSQPRASSGSSRHNTGTFFSSLSSSEVGSLKTVIKTLFSNESVWSLGQIVYFFSEHPKLKQFDKLIVYKALDEVVRLKEFVTDKHKQNGYVLYKNGFYIFNPMNVKPVSSVYKKTRPPRLEKPSVPLDAFQRKINETLGSLAIQPRSRTRPQPRARPQSPRQGQSPRSVHSNRSAQPTQSGQEIERIKSLPIYATLNITDGKFRIVDNRAAIETNDARKIKKGSVCESAGFTLAVLVDIFTIVTGDPPAMKMRKSDLCIHIKTAMVQKSMVVL